MEKHRQVKDTHGRVWTVQRVHQSEAEDADFEFWYRGMTPAERVLAVYEALESSLKAKGIHAVPRFRRVHRRVKCPWSQVIHGDR